MKAGELQDAASKMSESTEQRVSSLDILHLEESNSWSEPRLSNGSCLSPYQKLLESLRFDSKIQWELALGKRVGFYTFRGELGCGNFSRVKAGIHALTKEKVAIKILDKKKMDKKTKRLLCREISSMEKLHHPNIVHLYEVIHTDAKLHLVMEYAGGGELFTKLSTQGMMNEADAKIIFAQILSAVQHMHQHNVIHRDLKAENVFYSEKKHVKVGDFGFSTEANGSRQALNTFCGSPPYAAPELFRDSFYYGESVDIWAVGILLYFTVTGTMPFRAETVGKLKKRILSGEYSIPTHLSSDCKSLIRSILKPTPSERYTIADIKASDWLANVVFPKPLGYYRLEPTKIDLNHCRPEEAYALHHLDKLGLGQEQLKKFNHSSSAQSPFSWESKIDSNQSVASRKFFGGSRSLPSNMNDHVDVNEYSALVGTYRILLLRARKRLSGPSADEELRRLRVITTKVRANFQMEKTKPAVEWVCSLCEANNVSPASTKWPSPNDFNVLRNGSTSNKSHGNLLPPELKSSRTPSSEKSFSPSSESRTKNVKNTVRRTTQNSNVKSKFCVIL